MAAPTSPLHPHRFALPEEPGMRAGTLSLLLVAGTAAAGLVAGVLGTLLGQAVFGLDDQELLTEAGTWGYVAALGLLALMLAPAVVGIAFGIRASVLGDRRRGLLGIVLNAAIAAYLVVAVGASLLAG